MELYRFSGGEIEKMNSYVMRVKCSVDISMENMKEITAIREKLFGEKYYCLLGDLRKDFIGISEEVQEYAANNPAANKYRIAEAILVKNFGQQLPVSMYILWKKPIRPTKVFYKEEKAMEWLKGQHESFVEAKELSNSQN